MFCATFDFFLEMLLYLLLARLTKIVGCIFALLSGSCDPLNAIIYAEIFKTFALADPEEQYARATVLGLLYAALGFICFVGFTAEVGMYWCTVFIGVNDYFADVVSVKKSQIIVSVYCVIQIHTSLRLNDLNCYSNQGYLFRQVWHEIDLSIKKERILIYITSRYFVL